jgi:hypothetical protein
VPTTINNEEKFGCSPHAAKYLKKRIELTKRKAKGFSLFFAFQDQLPEKLTSIGNNTAMLKSFFFEKNRKNGKIDRTGIPR